MIIVGHARCQVIEGSEIEYPSAVARCEERMGPVSRLTMTATSLPGACEARF